MKYKILRTHLVFENNVLQEVAVLAESNGSKFGAVANNKPISGYLYLKAYDIPTITLFEQVAGYGRKLRANEIKNYFPNS